MAELAHVQRRIDSLDRQIERAQRRETKDRLSAERQRWIAYDAFLRRFFEPPKNRRR